MDETTRNLSVIDVDVAVALQLCLADLRSMRRDLLAKGTGQYGGVAIVGTAEVEPATGYQFYAVHVVADAVVAAQGDVIATNVDLTAIASIPAGTVIYGKWDSLTLTSGSVIAYYEPA